MTVAPVVAREGEASRRRAVRGGRAARRVAAVLALLTGLSACGDEPGVVPTSSGPDSAPRAPVERAAAPLPKAVDAAAEAIALVDAWQAAIHDRENGTHEEPFGPRILALGEPGLRALIDRIAADDRDIEFVSEAADLLPLFGVAAVRPLTALLGSASARVRGIAVEILERMAGAWACDESGPDVCRALVRQLDGECERDDVLAGLKLSRPAGRFADDDLAQRWLRSGEGAGDLYEVLLTLGPDAAPAARTLLAGLRDEQDDRRLRSADLLATIGASDLSLLPDLRAMLDGSEQERRHVAGILLGWGDAAAPAAPRLVDLLGDADPVTAVRAALALAGMPSTWETTWPALRAAVCRDLDSPIGQGRLLGLARKPDVARRLTADLPSLPADAIGPVYDALWEQALDRDDLSALRAVAGALLTHPAPDARRLALRPWDDAETPHPLPEGALALLADPDAGVRATAASLLALHHAAPAARLFEVASALRIAGDPAVRADAAAALGVLAQDGDAKALELAIAALADESAEVCSAAMFALGPSDAPIAGKHPAAVAALARYFVDCKIYEMSPVRGVLLRLDGGADALAGAVTTILDRGRDADFIRFDDALDAVVAAGPRLASLRPLLVHLRDGATQYSRADFERAIASIDGEAANLAALCSANPDEVRRLLAMGAPGRLAAVSLAGKTFYPDDAMLRWFDGVPMADAVAAAAAPPQSGESEKDAQLRRTGAARLAPLLPAARAVGLLVPLAEDAEVEVSDRAAASLAAIEATSPGAVPVEFIAARLRGEVVRAEIERLAGRLGPRGAPLAPRLRELRDSDASGERLRAEAAVALWRITRREDESLPTLRGLLARPERLERGLPWAEISSVLREAHMGPDDVAAVIVSLRCAATRDREVGEVREAREGFGGQFPPGWQMDESLAPLAAALEPSGPAAAAAVPALRVALGRSLDDADRKPCPGEAIARTLAAIGSAARDALPDLRRYAASTSDPRGVVADAIRRIEAASR